MLSIIIVSYKAARLVIDCLESVYRYNKRIPYEVILVDNGSNDNSKELITSRFPEVVWLEMGYNSGFPRANNLGMRHAKGSVWLLLNPDTIATDNAIEQCYERLVASHYIAAGIQLLNEDGSRQTSGSFFVKGGLNHILMLPYWGRFVRWIGYRFIGKSPGVAVPREVEEVDWINGAFLMVKKTSVDKAGMLDEDLFLYSDEIEWCSRLQKTGPLCIFGNLTMIHLQGEVVNNDLGTADKGYHNLYDRTGLQLMVSHHVRVRKQYGIGWFFFLLLNFTWGIVVLFFCSIIHLLFLGRNPFGYLPKVKALGKNVFTVWKLMPRILSGKPHFYKMYT